MNPGFDPGFFYAEGEKMKGIVEGDKLADLRNSCSYNMAYNIYYVNQ